MNFRKIVKSFIPKKLFRSIEPYGHWSEAVLLNSLNRGSPARTMKVIGVTGTNGKTTTCFLIHRMLHEAGYKVGLMTTAGYGAGNNIKPQIDHMTTVSVPKLIKRLEELKGQGVEWLVMETTSHALAQHRDAGIPYSVAVLTNITHEHLDYHGTFERYVAAKRMLFTRTNQNKKGLQTGVVNADDGSAGQFVTSMKNSLTYGIDHGNLRAKNINLTAKGVSYKATVGDDSYQIKCHLPGKFNVYNSLAAIGVGRVLGLDKKAVEQGIAALPGVPGRMTAVDAGQNFNVLVDFAHSPDALENVLRACRELTKGKLILVFGATGDRDKLKRPVMGEVAAKNADLIFLTDDETYTENPKTIIDAVNKGIERAKGKAKTTVIDSRLEAIRAAFSKAKDGDTVLLTGMGHLTTRNMGGKEEPWNEIEIAKKLLKTR
ncbi:MAG TPA: UDP-N-acetylmuramoyl-L-alanyl-D-glutamate--2,6-diaminopimelate ligase [Candidatus Binatia bacterium]|nr:UDP-N-acetylmuramoyl-L-alanyl-D-glutamate--2,6-diaminopimelate ligase [Candidatus Binatia bacterium]